MVRFWPARRHGRAAVGVAVAALLVVTGCSSGSGEGAATSGAATSATAQARPAPVLDEDFPDPDVLRVGDTYYAYATQRPGPNRNLQIARSADLRTWEVLDQDPLPRLPDWATTGRT